MLNRNIMSPIKTSRLGVISSDDYPIIKFTCNNPETNRGDVYLFLEQLSQTIQEHDGSFVLFIDGEKAKPLPKECKNLLVAGIRHLGEEHASRFKKNVYYFPNIYFILLLKTIITITPPSVSIKVFHNKKKAQQYLETLKKQIKTET